MKIFFIDLKILNEYKDSSVVEYILISINRNYSKVDPNFLRDL
jgi:hypothetical protein